MAKNNKSSAVFFFFFRCVFLCGNVNRALDCSIISELTSSCSFSMGFFQNLYEQDSHLGNDQVTGGGDDDGRARHQLRKNRLVLKLITYARIIIAKAESYPRKTGNVSLITPNVRLIASNDAVTINYSYSFCGKGFL